MPGFQPKLKKNSFSSINLSHPTSCKESKKPILRGLDLNSDILDGIASADQSKMSPVLRERKRTIKRRLSAKHTIFGNDLLKVVAALRAEVKKKRLPKIFDDVRFNELLNQNEAGEAGESKQKKSVSQKWRTPTKALEEDYLEPINTDRRNLTSALNFDIGGLKDLRFTEVRSIRNSKALRKEVRQERP
jgi:hypothetical protein